MDINQRIAVYASAIDYQSCETHADCRKTVKSIPGGCHWSCDGLVANTTGAISLDGFLETDAILASLCREMTLAKVSLNCQLSITYAACVSGRCSHSNTDPSVEGSP